MFAFVDSCCYVMFLMLFLCVISVQLSLLILLLQLYTRITSSNTAVAWVFSLFCFKCRSRCFLAALTFEFIAIDEVF
jgi:hypothetical protein